MIMEILPSSYFSRKYKKFVKKHPQLSSKIDQKLELFRTDQNHPSLRLHKLSAKNAEVWSISISTEIRVLFTYTSGGVILIDVGSHDEVY